MVVGMPNNAHAVAGKGVHQGIDVQPLRQSVIDTILVISSAMSYSKSSKHRYE